MCHESGRAPVEEIVFFNDKTLDACVPHWDAKLATRTLAAWAIIIYFKGANRNLLSNHKRGFLFLFAPLVAGLNAISPPRPLRNRLFLAEIQVLITRLSISESRPGIVSNGVLCACLNYKTLDACAPH